MNITVCTDESGVFDKEHETIYVFGGVIFLSDDDSISSCRKYISAETSLREAHTRYKSGELKANRLKNKHKNSLFRSLNNEIKFSIVIHLDRVMDRIFDEKKSKQRYLDYVYKVGLKKVFNSLISRGIINPDEVYKLKILCDEHTTATNGRYELAESLVQEFKTGTFNYSWNIFYPPIFTNLNILNVDYCNSSKKPQIRMADIIANKAYYLAKNDKLTELESKIITYYFP